MDLAVGGPGVLIDSRDYEIISTGFQSLQAQFLDLQASYQRLQFENVTLRLRLSQRKSRRSFERKVCAILGAWLFLLLLLIGLVRYF